MKRFLISLTLLLIVFTFTACSDNDSPVVPNNDPLVLTPLKVGNWWRMHTVVDRDGVPFYESTDTVRIDTSFAWGGFVWFGSSGSNYFQRNNIDGLWTLYLYPSGDSGRVELTYKYPVTVGESWTTQPDTIIYNVESIEKTVVTPNATYLNCIQYNSIVTTSNEMNIEYFKPGVGKILSNSIIEISGNLVRAKIEIISYHLE